MTEKYALLENLQNETKLEVHFFRFCHISANVLPATNEYVVIMILWLVKALSSQ
jgi:hypothetical protein